MKLPEKKIIKYLRDKHNKPVGVLVAIRTVDGTVSVSYSLCNKKDKFDKELGLTIAINRAMVCSFPVHEQYPPTLVINELRNGFLDRVATYFKVNKNDIYTWVEE